MPFITIELSGLHAEVRRMADENERDLAACAGHDFYVLNDRIRASKYACRVCRGVVGHEVAQAHMAKAAA